jgi:hypothetical protein
VRTSLPAILLALLAAAPARAACDVPEGWSRAESGAVTVAWKADPAIATGRFFAIDFRICGPAPSAGVPRIDATMPRHGHGMNYRPKVARLAPGTWRAEGLFLHMAGAWRLVFEVPDGETVTRVPVELDVRR